MTEEFDELQFRATKKFLERLFAEAEQNPALLEWLQNLGGFHDAYAAQEIRESAEVRRAELLKKRKEEKTLRWLLKDIDIDIE